MTVYELMNLLNLDVEADYDVELLDTEGTSILTFTTLSLGDDKNPKAVTPQSIFADTFSMLEVKDMAICLRDQRLRLWVTPDVD